MPTISEEDIPDLPSLTLPERLSWDLETHFAARVHPMILARRHLNHLEVRPIETLHRMGGTVRVRRNASPPTMRTAGLVIGRQMPPTSKGCLFLMLEDETGQTQCVVRPDVLERLDQVLRSSALIVQGQVSIAGNWRGIVLQDAWGLDSVIGGYEGQQSRKRYLGTCHCG